jgi:hypothetical protein
MPHPRSQADLPPVVLSGYAWIAVLPWAVIRSDARQCRRRRWGRGFVPPRRRRGHHPARHHHLDAYRVPAQWRLCRWLRSERWCERVSGAVGIAGNKDDRFDAYVLADTVRTDRRRLTPLVLDSEATRALRKLCRARKDLVAHRVAVANQLRSHLATALAAVVDLFRDINSAISLRLLTRFTTQDAVDWLSPKRLAALLASVGYCGRTSRSSVA